MSNEIKLFKLTSGEHVVAKVISSNDHTISIEKPHLVFFQELEGGKVTISMQPFAPFSLTPKIDLERLCIQYQSHLNKNIAAKYQELTSPIITNTGIVTPDNPGIILG